LFHARGAATEKAHRRFACLHVRVHGTTMSPDDEARMTEKRPSH